MPMSTTLRSRSRLVERAIAERDLRDDLVGAQVALEPRDAARAEHAAHRAADLRAHALRDRRELARRRRRCQVRPRSPSGRTRSVGRAEPRGISTLSMCRPSASACTSLLVPSFGHVHPREREGGTQARFRKPRAQRLGQIGHLLRVEHAALVDPAEHLLRAVARLAQGRQQLRPLLGHALRRRLGRRELDAHDFAVVSAGNPMRNLCRIA